MSNVLKVTKNNISFLVEDSKELHQDIGYNFWQDKYANWEGNTFSVFDNFLSKEKDFLDIGSWVGPTAIYASFLSRNVIAIEPDPIAFKILNTNINLNNISNVQTINKALSTLDTCYISSNKFFGDSMTRVSSDSKKGILVDPIKLETLISMGDYSLIKMDIEGSEFDIIQNYNNFLNEIKIPLYLSLHSPFFSDGNKKIKDLTECFSGVKKIFDEFGKEIKLNEIQSGFFSYLFCW